MTTTRTPSKPYDGPAKTTTTSSTPRHEAVPEDAVRRKAYEIYMSRVARKEAGDSASDWLRAEQELRQQGAGRRY